MNRITEHKPIYAIGREVEIVEFSSTDELLKIDFVNSHSHQDDFYRYSINRSSYNVRIPLLAEYNKGEKWIVIGFLEGDIDGIKLPEWKSTESIHPI